MNKCGPQILSPQMGILINSSLSEIPEEKLMQYLSIAEGKVLSRFCPDKKCCGLLHDRFGMCAQVIHMGTWKPLEGLPTSMHKNNCCESKGICSCSKKCNVCDPCKKNTSGCYKCWEIEETGEIDGIIYPQGHHIVMTCHTLNPKPIHFDIVDCCEPVHCTVPWQVKHAIAILAEGYNVSSGCGSCCYKMEVDGLKFETDCNKCGNNCNQVVEDLLAPLLGNCAYLY